MPPTAKHVQRGGTPRSGKYSLFALADGLIEGGRGGGGCRRGGCAALVWRGSDAHAKGSCGGSGLGGLSCASKHVQQSSTPKSGECVKVFHALLKGLVGDS